MRDLLARLQDYAPLQSVAEALERGEDQAVEGLWGSSSAYLTAALSAGAAGTRLCILPEIEQAEKFAEDMDLFAPGIGMLFPPRETLAEERLPDAEILSRRLGVLKALRARRESAADAARGLAIVAPVQAILQTTPSPETMSENVLVLRGGMTQPPEAVATWLTDRGFQQVRRVETPGEYSRRGGILDVFPYAADLPCRVEFFGDAVESVRNFDPVTQTSTKPVEELSITALPRRAPAAKPKWSTLFDHLPPDAVLILRGSAEIAARAKSFNAQEIDPLQGAAGLWADAFLDAASFQRRLAGFRRLNLAALPGTLGGRPIGFHVHSIERFRGEIATVVNELRLIVKERRRTIVFCGNEGERRRLRELLS